MSDIELYKRSPNYIGAEPFKGDLFERKILAEKLTRYVDRLKDGCVIGIDAPWGEGKSWFGRNWHAQLIKDGYPTVYLDAFENDFVDDPFLVIASELVDVADQLKDTSAKRALIRKAKSIGKKILPIGVKAAVSIAGKVILGGKTTEELRDALKNVADDFGDAAEKYVENRIKDHDLSRKNIEGFRKTLADFAGKQEKPVVFFIDELDRCKPTFAVQVIERIKHFFDAPNLVFVLLLNRSQLEAAIRGIYGQNVNATAYLGKFFHFFLTLPKKISTEENPHDYNSIYLSDLAKRHEYPDKESVRTFIDTMANFASWLGLSFRDLERSFIHFGLAQPIDRATGFAAYLISIRISRPDIFAQLATNSKDGHTAAIALLNRPEVRNDVWIVPILKALHSAHLKNFMNLTAEETELLSQIEPSLHMRPKNFIRWIIKKIDIQITD